MHVSVHIFTILSAFSTCHTKWRCHSVLYSARNTCQPAVGSPRNTPNNIKFASYSMYTASTRRYHSIFLASMTLRTTVRKQNDDAACSWRYRQLHSAHKALLATAQRAPRRSALFNSVGTL